MFDVDTMTCSQQDPPDDHTFTILVALLTTILSAPLLVTVTYVLNTYASTWPGSRGIEDDVGKEKVSEVEKNGEKSEENVEPNIAAQLRNSTRKSEFQDVIKKAVLRGGMAGKDPTAELVKFAYAGRQSDN